MAGGARGRRGRFRYLDGRGNPIGDPAKIERIESLVIPPAWKDVWISPRAGAKLQATGVDKAGRRQYLYHPEFRARQEQAKFDKLVRFAEALPELRQAMGEHMTHDPYDRERVCAVAVRLINMAWFRVGSDRYAKTSRTHGVTTLTRSHVTVRGHARHVPLPGEAQGAGADVGRRRTSSRRRSRTCSRSPGRPGSSATATTATRATSPAPS